MFYSLNDVKSDFDRYDKNFLIYVIFLLIFGDELPDSAVDNLDVSGDIWRALTCIHIMSINGDHKKYGW